MIVCLKDLFVNPFVYENKNIFVRGWIRNCRYQKKIFFIDFNDGTFVKDMQVVCKKEKNFFLEQNKTYLQIGASIEIQGLFIRNSKLFDNFEIEAENIKILGESSFKYPIQPKHHSKVFLRQVNHLRIRTKVFSSIFRIRSTAFLAIHDFFKKSGFLMINTPIITSNDGEGAGNLFQVTSLDLEKNKNINYSEDFFGKKVFLTVTGQLELEALSSALNKVYTFGPIFRAENSNTPRHISEFWMLEVEMSFCDLEQNLEVAENMLKTVVKTCLLDNKSDFEFLDSEQSPGLIIKLQKMLEINKFPRIEYKDAVEILIKSKIDFQFKPFYGIDLCSEHERYLTEVYFNSPIFLINYPKGIKAFYMKINEDDQTVACMDLLLPFIGELIGGSQREERLDVLTKRMQELKVSSKNLEWYLDLRRFGSCMHSGFGLGFERLLMYLTGMKNIRDVTAFPRIGKIF